MSVYHKEVVPAGLASTPAATAPAGNAAPTRGLIYDMAIANGRVVAAVQVRAQETKDGCILEEKAVCDEVSLLGRLDRHASAHYSTTPIFCGIWPCRAAACASLTLPAASQLGWCLWVQAARQ